MEPLNYHHLRLFQAVAREGHLTRASAKLHLTPQTVSAQIRSLEAAVGEPLFRRTGRRMVLSEVGQIALLYADEIFALGQEMQVTLRGEPGTRPLRLVVGSTDILHKLIVQRLIEPAMRIEQQVHVVAREGSPTELLGELATHRIDVLLSDSPIPPLTKIRAYNHLLGSSSLTFMASPKLAGRLQQDFPESLNDAPVLLPGEHALVRRELDEWFNRRNLHPTIIGEFEDSALLMSFGQAGEGFFSVPSVVEEEVARQYQVLPIGVAEGIAEHYYAISAERRVRHPAVLAICDAARTGPFS